MLWEGFLAVSCRQPRLGLSLPGAGGCWAAIPDTLLPVYVWAVLGILGGFFALCFSGERFVTRHHCPHPSRRQQEWLAGKGGVSSDFPFFQVSKSSPHPPSFWK